MEKELLNSIKAKTKIIQIISYETLRIHGAIIGVVEELEWDLFVWNRIDGIRKWERENKEFISEDEDARNSSAALEFFMDETLQKSILLLVSVLKCL